MDTENPKEETLKSLIKRIIKLEKKVIDLESKLEKKANKPIVYGR